MKWSGGDELFSSPLDRRKDSMSEAAIEKSVPIRRYRSEAHFLRCSRNILDESLAVVFERLPTLAQLLADLLASVRSPLSLSACSRRWSHLRFGSFSLRSTPFRNQGAEMALGLRVHQ